MFLTRFSYSAFLSSFSLFLFQFLLFSSVIIAFFNLLVDPIKIYVSVHPQPISLSLSLSSHYQAVHPQLLSPLPSLPPSYLSHLAGNCSCGCISSCHNLLFSAHNNKITFNYAQLEAALHMSISLPPPTLPSLSLHLPSISLCLWLCVCIRKM